MKQRRTDPGLKIVATSYERYNGGVRIKRLYGSSTVTLFFVHYARDAKNASAWKKVEGYGPTPGDRKTDAIRRSGLLTPESAPGAASGTFTRTHFHGHKSLSEILDERRAKAEQGDWIPASGGTEKPFHTRSGKRLQYLYQPSTGRHAYYDVESDIILSDDEAFAALGMFGKGTFL